MTTETTIIETQETKVPPSPVLSEPDYEGIAEEARYLFPNNVFQRVIHYCREATNWARSRPDLPLSPRVVSPFMCGHAGYGKTSIMKEYAATVGLRYIERKLGGITDIAEVFGMVDTVNGETVLQKPSWWPKPGEACLINFDD